MKRTTFTLFLTLLLGFFMSVSAQGVGNEDVVLMKGKIVDIDRDGEYDKLDFKVKTKKGILDIPVTSVCIALEDGRVIEYVPFESDGTKKRIDSYEVSIENLGVTSRYLQLIVTLDVSELMEDDSGYIPNSGPGTKPNETVLVIKYP